MFIHKVSRPPRTRRGRWLRVALVLAMPVAPAAAAVAADGPAAAAATVTPINLTANWTADTDYGAAAPGWYLDSSNVVHLQGGVRQLHPTGNPSLIGTLPFAPGRDIYTIVHTLGGTYADLGIRSDGEIGLIAPKPPAQADYSYVSLDGVTFSYRNFPTPIPLTSYWSPHAGYDSTPPAWFEDSSGYVHLQGAARLLMFGNGSDQIATLPPAARPLQDVYTIVHTFAGTYADLHIGTDGEIRVIGPAAPGNTPGWADYSFVSLDGISYPHYYDSGGTGYPVAVNGSSWTPADQDQPWVRVDLDGNLHLVHLSGHVRMLSGGPNSDLIGTVPLLPFMRPPQTVYTIVHTFAGTYADVSISPDGQIRVIGPRPPAIANYSFLSLDGITYQSLPF